MAGRATFSILVFNLVIAGIGGGAVYTLHQRHLAELGELRSAWRHDQHEVAATAATRIERDVATVYAGIRTVARLPGVRKSLTTGVPLSEDAHTTVQELYNSLATAVDVSEVYLVPLALDPDARADSDAPRAPPITFDDLIVGPARDKDEAEEGEEVEEIEIFEYRAMREQLAWFAAHAKTDAGLAVPLLTSGELVTCDNRHFDPKHPDDHARSGLILTTPAYSADGTLVGAVSAIVLSSVFEALVPAGDTLLLPLGRVAAGPSLVPADGKVDPDLAWSEVLPLKVTAGQGSWALWAGRPEAEFAALDAVAAEDTFCRVGGGLIGVASALLALVGSVVWSRQVRERRAVSQILAVAGEAASGRLEARSRVRGADVPGRLGAAFDSLAESIERSIVSMVKTAGRLEADVERLTPSTDAIGRLVVTASERAEAASEGTSRLRDEVARMAAGIEQMRAKGREITEEAQSTARVASSAVEAATDAADTAARLVETGREIGQIASQISDIAEGTRLLALNASIEAARAGTFGAGFMVVANQVRSLAEESAVAADVVTRRVDAIRGSSEEMQSRMVRIQGVIEEIAERQRIIGEAVTDQSAATTEMAQVSAEVAGDAREVGDAIEAAAEATREAAQAATQVASAGQGVAGSTQELREACAWYQRDAA